MHASTQALACTAAAAHADTTAHGAPPTATRVAALLALHAWGRAHSTPPPATQQQQQNLLTVSGFQQVFSSVPCCLHHLPPAPAPALLLLHARGVTRTFARQNLLESTVCVNLSAHTAAALVFVRWTCAELSGCACLPETGRRWWQRLRAVLHSSAQSQ